MPAALTFECTPGLTAAGVLHYAVSESGDVYLLLGNRDTGGLCNLGGLSDEEISPQNEPEVENIMSSQADKSVISGDISVTASREET